MFSRFAFPFRLPRFLPSALVALPLLGAGLPAFAQTKVVFGTSGSLQDSSLAIQVAIDQGYYRDAGINAEVINFKGGAPAVQALITGGIQYCVCAPEHVVRLRARGLDGVVAFALDARHTYALLAKDGSPEKSIIELKGKKVGITSPGSLTENLVSLQAKRGGLNPARDIELVGIGGGTTQKAGLDSGQTAAGMFVNVDALQLVGRGYHVVYDWRTQVTPSLALLSRDRILDENPAAARGVVQATLRAQQLILADRKVAAAALAKLYPNLDAAGIQRVVDDLPRRLSPSGLYTRPAFDHLQDELLEIEPDLKRVDFAVAAPVKYFPHGGAQP